MALRDCRVKILVHDPERQLGQAAEDLGATLLDGASVDEVANVVIALSVAGPDFLVRVMHATGPSNILFYSIQTLSNSTQSFMLPWIRWQHEGAPRW